MIQNLLAAWNTPGMHLIISERKETDLFWQQVRAQQENCSVLSVPNTKGECTAWFATLSQSFLGQSHTYWLDLPATWAPKAKADVLAFLQKYNGPHAVWLLLDEATAAQLATTTVKRYAVSAQISYNKLSVLAQLFNCERGMRALEHAGIVRRTGSMTLNQASNLLRHAQFVPLRLPHESQQYLSRLLPHEQSLSGVADLFFRNSPEKFLTAWNKCSSLYSDMFWIAFWSEQVWRAYWTCFYLQQGQSARARAMSFRLPQSFMRETWKKQDVKKLLKLYQQLYFFDTRVKKGSLFTLSELLTTLMNAI